MLNLSDKELDRLSREAAQEHDPGDVLGSRSWEKLEPRLDSDLGKAGPNPLRGVRRFPFYYVPAILLVAGVFYFARQNHQSHQDKASGSPPSAQAAPSNPATNATQPSSSTQNPEHNANSTPSVSSPVSADRDPAAASQQPTAESSADRSGYTKATAPAALSPNGSAAVSPSGTAGPSPGKTSAVNPTATSPASPDRTTAANRAGSTGRTTGRTTNFRNHRGRGLNTIPGALTHRPSGASKSGSPSETAIIDANSANTANSANAAQSGVNPTTPHELTLSAVRGPRSQKQRAPINDSALRAYTTAKTPISTIQPSKNKSNHINRNLQFGLSIAPDFSSVKTMAGDKAGSSIGLTLDYRFASHWYLSTGLFLDRKNYAARAEDYHVPYDYYRNNGLHNVSFVKGSFNMLEIPLNLRYDFSTTGNTLFFASAGASSYLLTNENSNYYFNMFGREDCRNFKYTGKNNYLFSTMNLSIGVETGISNNLSLVVAPYVKLPVRNIGFGQVQMSSVGINFALKFAPVTSRKRK